MYIPVYTRQFERDIKRSVRRGKNMEKFKTLSRLLLEGKPLAATYHDHRLSGNYAGRRDCHIESDWLVIYAIKGDRLIFERMGTHADLLE